MQLTFHGAAGRVTGSLHLLEAAGARIALDAGLFQGPRAESSQLNRALPFDPRRLDSIILSHAHIDHIGRLPLLVRHGFHGPIYATPATRDLAAVMLPDARATKLPETGSPTVPEMSMLPESLLLKLPLTLLPLDRMETLLPKVESAAYGEPEKFVPPPRVVP